MKKIYVSLCALVGTFASFAQTIDNAGFETWRSGSVGTAPMPVVAIQAPDMWYGFDSVVIAGEEQYLPAFLGVDPTNLNAQVFKETTIIHSGSAAAKLVSVKQDTLGFIAGALSNAQPSLDPLALATGDFSNAIIYNGGTVTNLRITSATAWMEYFPGKDSITGMFGGNDSGTFVIQAYSNIGGVETMVGSGTKNVGPTSAYTAITVNVDYSDLVNPVDLVRIFFGSGNVFNTLDSSTAYVDDVSMVGVDQSNAVVGMNAQNQVAVYPNPAATTIYIGGLHGANLTCNLISATGQVVATKAITGNGAVDISSLPAGIYTYVVADEHGTNIQRGKVSIAH